MTISHATPVRTAFGNTVLNVIDGGAGFGQCVLKDTGVEAAAIVLNKPSFVNTDGQLVLDASGPPSDPDAAGGTPDTFEFQDSTGVLAFAGAVGTDITLSKATIAVDDVVELTSYTYNASP